MGWQPFSIPNRFRAVSYCSCYCQWFGYNGRFVRLRIRCALISTHTTTAFRLSPLQLARLLFEHNIQLPGRIISLRKTSVGVCSQLLSGNTIARFDECFFKMVDSLLLCTVASAESRCFDFVFMACLSELPLRIRVFPASQIHPEPSYAFSPFPI